MGLTYSATDVAGESQYYDVVIVGGGAAASSVVDRLMRYGGLRVLLLERGERVVDSHVNNHMDNSLRPEFIKRFKSNPWTGAMKDGMLLHMLGGRGVAAGANMVRFYADDFDCWPQGAWPSAVVQQLPQLYADVTRDRRVSQSAICGEFQRHCQRVLHAFVPGLPNVAVDLKPPVGFAISKGYDSSVGRLIPHLLGDTLRFPKFQERRIIAATGAYVVRLLWSGARVTGLECIDTQRPGRPRFVRAGVYVLAASAIESARLVLASGLGSALVAAGRYLAEHIERRAKIKVKFDGSGDAVSMLLPPPSSNPLDRYQIHLRGVRDKSTSDFVVDVGGFAAMDPQPGNRVTLSEENDDFGLPKAHTALCLSPADYARAGRLATRIVEVAGVLGGDFITERFPLETVQPEFTDERKRVQMMPAGRSYHECGTLRIGTVPSSAVTDDTGRVFGLDNLYVADAGLFPCAGVANPMFTISALSYLVADTIQSALGQPAAATA